MYHKILVPLDGSRLAEEILPHVEMLARCSGAELVLLRVPAYAYEDAAGDLWKRGRSGLARRGSARVAVSSRTQELGGRKHEEL